MNNTARSSRSRRLGSFWTYRNTQDGITLTVGVDVSIADPGCATVDLILDNEVVAHSAPITVIRDDMGGKGRIQKVHVGDPLAADSGFARTVIGAAEDWASNQAAALLDGMHKARRQRQAEATEA